MLVFVLCSLSVWCFDCYYFAVHFGYLLLASFSPPALVGGLSLESEWQQVSSSLQDFSRYSNRSKQCCGLDDLDSSSDSQLFQLSFPSYSQIRTIAWFLYGHLPSISQTIQVRWRRYPMHCWRSKVLSWTPAHGHISVGWPAKTLIRSVWTLDTV